MKNTNLKWRWWYNFVAPIEIVTTTGCLSDKCDDNVSNIDIDGCKCNNFNQVTKTLIRKGFVKVKTKFGMWDGGVREFWVNNRHQLIVNYHTCGR
jgi:hypothetical protein